MEVNRVITKRLLNQKEAASYLGISVRQLEYLVHDGRLSRTRLPDTSKRLFDVFDLDALVEQSKNSRAAKKVTARLKEPLALKR